MNVGSSSIKFATYTFEKSLNKENYGAITNIGLSPALKHFNASGKLITETTFDKNQNYTYFYNYLFDKIIASGNKINAIGHRVVHGGHTYVKPILVTQQDIENLKKLNSFAPLHQPFNLKAIEVINDLAPTLPQVACFDTAFHRTHSKLADTFGLPREYTDSGICRYGFHGLSYEYVLSQLNNKIQDIKLKKIIVAHLGNGASMCAIKNGESLDSTMGFTALDGLMMGTRCGSIDPGVILYLMKFKNMNHDNIEELLYKKSGLLGVSTISSNMATLIASNDPRAKEAVELFAFRARREIGALASSLNGLDMLVFTGGIGENASMVRELICQDMAWLGIKLDPTLNAQHNEIINKADSRVEIRVMPTDEEQIIANHTYKLLTQR